MPAPHALRPESPRHRAGAALALAALLAAHGLPAAAGPAADAALAAERLMAEGRVAEAAAALRAAGFALLDRAPALGFAEVVLVEDAVTSYGAYTPRASARYAPGEPILVYVEPVGLAAVPQEDGSVVQGFVVDLVVSDGGGAVIASAPALVQGDVRGRRRAADFFVALSFDLTGLPPGRYRLESTMRDQNSARAGSFAVEIEVGG
ncbi:MAG: hypothetical protein IT545_14560 [Rhodobacteraceae bacterium]|nr:hypothetical protein [Paracoccaceae bacterium]